MPVCMMVASVLLTVERRDVRALWQAAQLEAPAAPSVDSQVGACTMVMGTYASTHVSVCICVRFASDACCVHAGRPCRHGGAVQVAVSGIPAEAGAPLLQAASASTGCCGAAKGREAGG